MMESVKNKIGDEREYVEIEVDDRTYKQIHFYAAIMQVSPEELLEKALSEYLKKHKID